MTPPDPVLSPPATATVPARPNSWAPPITRLRVGSISAEAVNRNVEGRRLSGPVQGFGPLWQKTYRVRLDGATISPQQLVARWKAEFASFWPQTGRFYASMSEITPGDVAVLNLQAGPLKICTGVLVLYADETAFTVMTPEGHQFAGFNTFSAYTDRGATVAQIQALLRASDPLFDAGMLLGHRIEDRFWQATLRNLAARVGAGGATVSLERVKLDGRRQWRHWPNVRHNAVVGSMLWALTAPLRRISRPPARRG